MITDLAAFSGMEMENMTRGHGWRFLDVGRRLERAMNAISSGPAGARSAGPSDNAVLEPLLEIADSSMTYRRRYFARPQLCARPGPAARSTTPIPAPLAFQLAAVSEHVRHLPRDPRSPVADARGTVDRSSRDDAAAGGSALGPSRTGEEGARALTALLGSIEDDLRALSEAITYFYFSHAELRVS